MSLNRDQFQRLIFIKYLLGLAESSTRQNRPFSSAAILQMHDALEMLLQLAMEILLPEVPKPNDRILESATDRLNQHKRNNKVLINVVYISKLNKIRNNLKHTSILVDDDDIRNLLTETINIMVAQTKSIFELDYLTVSEIELVMDEQIRSYLKDADKLVTSGDLRAGMISLSKAFFQFGFSVYDVKTMYGTIFHSRKFPIHVYSAVDFEILRGANIDKSVAKVFNIHENNIGALFDFMIDVTASLTYGVDYVALQKVKKSIANLSWHIADSKMIFDEPYEENHEWTITDYAFSSQFILQWILKAEQGKPTFRHPS